jgi:ketosteroid isomerase-like protein
MSKTMLFLGAVILAVCALVAAQAPDTRMGPQRKAPATPGSLAENQILQVEHDWAQAFLNHDIAALETFLAEDWTYSPSDGTFKTRTEFIEEFRIDTMKYESITQQNLKVRVYGNTAVVTGDELIKGSDGGKAITSHIRITDVLVKRGDRWQAVASHETNILEPSDAPPAP